MKYYIVIVLLVVLSCNSRKIKKETDVERKNFIGNVREVFIRNYYASWVEGAVRKKELIMDHPGDVSLRFDSTGKILFHLSGNRGENYVYGGNGELQKKYIRDKNGKNIFLHEFFYNKDGLLEKTIIKDIINNEERYINSSYYEDGTLKSEEGNGPRSINKFVINYYNENGLLVKKVSSDNITSDFIEEFEYLNGVLSKSLFYTADSSIYFSYKYDERKNIIEQTDYSKEKGPLQAVNGGSTSITKLFRRKFDDKGNWIEQTEFINNDPVKITERFISYY